MHLLLYLEMDIKFIFIHTINLLEDIQDVQMECINPIINALIAHLIVNTVIYHLIIVSSVILVYTSRILHAIIVLINIQDVSIALIIYATTVIKIVITNNFLNNINQSINACVNRDIT